MTALDLDRIQGFVVRGYRLPLARYIFLRIDDPAAAVKSRDQDGAGGLTAYFANHTSFFAARRLLDRL